MLSRMGDVRPRVPLLLNSARMLRRLERPLDGKRDLRIDWLRGLAMTCVIVDHSRLWSLLSWFTYETVLARHCRRGVRRPLGRRARHGLRREAAPPGVAGRGPRPLAAVAHLVCRLPGRHDLAARRLRGRTRRRVADRIAQRAVDERVGLARPRADALRPVAVSNRRTVRLARGRGGAVPARCSAASDGACSSGSAGRCISGTASHRTR